MTWQLTSPRKAVEGTERGERSEMSFGTFLGGINHHFYHVLLVVQTNPDTLGEGVHTMRYGSLGAILKTGYHCMPSGPQ